uniref:50S ribosomal protein L34 n=1 Tax=Vertebrata lanosa TaxID=1261582 RepID=A0A0B5W615_9FLOR|nr:50S ribosomal protein L34 [Vertebrata lanosa]AJH66056.1 50S ribosomal protein L34 [Vertebrata lanosa]
MMKTVSKLRKKRKNGFLVRMETKAGQKVIALRRKKKRQRLITH